jgi:hypothetical protein
MEPIPHPLNFPTNHALPLTHSYMPLPRIPAFFATCHIPSAQFIPSNAIPLWDMTNFKSLTSPYSQSPLYTRFPTALNLLHEIPKGAQTSLPYRHRATMQSVERGM